MVILVLLVYLVLYTVGSLNRVSMERTLNLVDQEILDSFCQRQFPFYLSVRGHPKSKYFGRQKVSIFEFLADGNCERNAVFNKAIGALIQCVTLARIS